MSMENKYLFIFLLIIILLTHAKTKRSTIMLSPTGHASDTGRPLSDGFERGATRQLAETIKKKLEGTTRVILTHNAGEHITQEQKANFANRLNVSLYIAFTIYNDDPLSINSYYYKQEPFSPTIGDRLAFYPAQQAYLKYAHVTETIAKKGLVPNHYQNTFTIFKPIGIPIKLLEGIIAPAFTFEISIKKTDDILVYVKPLTDAIKKIINEHNL